MLWNTIAVNEKPDKSNVGEERLTVSEDYITEEDVKTVVEASLGSNIQVINYHTKIFPDVKISFLGVRRHLNVTVKISEEAEEKVYSYFLKIIPYHIDSQTSTAAEEKFFYKETNFYRYVVPELLKNASDDSFIARCYLVKVNALVSENLTVKNFHVRDLFLNDTLLKSALSSLAKLHAASILAENRLGKTFVELYPDIFEEWLFTKTGKMFKWFESSVDVLVSIAKFLGLNDQYIPKICDNIFKLLSPSKTTQNVVCHGDVQSSNLMFDDSQPTPICVLVDFQVVRYIPPMADVAQLIYINCSRELRKNLEEGLLKHYYTVFSSILEEGNLKEKIPSYDEILQQYQALQLIGLVTNALYSPMQHIEEANGAELTSDSDVFSKLAFEDRYGVIIKIMQEDEKYKDVLKEVISEINERAADFL